MKGKAFAILFSWLLIIVCINGELPPSVYNDWKKSAQEVLHIRVTKIKPTRDIGLDKEGCVSEKWLNIDAEVLRIERTAPQSDDHEGVKQINVGDTVNFESYFRDEIDGCYGWAGPSPPIALKEHNCYVAYMNRTGRRNPLLELAAGGKSFERTTN